MEDVVGNDVDLQAILDLLDTKVGIAQLDERGAEGAGSEGECAMDGDESLSEGEGRRERRAITRCENREREREMRDERMEVRRRVSANLSFLCVRRTSARRVCAWRYCDCSGWMDSSRLMHADMSPLSSFASAVARMTDSTSGVLASSALASSRVRNVAACEERERERRVHEEAEVTIQETLDANPIAASCVVARHLHVQVQLVVR